MRTLRKTAIVLPVLSFLALMLSSCAFVDLMKDLERQMALARITGRVSSAVTSDSYLVVALMKEVDAQPVLVNYVVLHRPGPFNMPVEPGIYRLYVIADENRDMAYQANERLAFSGPHDIKRGEHLRVDLELPAEVNPALAASIEQLRSRVSIELVNSKQYTGTVVSLNDRAFSEENVAIGQWQPLKAIEELPMGIFLLEEYDPAKQPVLFVHGINASPRQFKPMIAFLDRTKFQPWVAFYPSGYRLPPIASYLVTELKKLHRRFRYDSLPIVAHSMGGLIARTMINELHRGARDMRIPAFITTSTPWNGHRAAASGLKWAPAAVPAWFDIAPGSDFLARLASSPLPPATPHYLLFSFEGRGAFTRGNNDGVVALASVLHPAVQRQAALVRGYPANHVSILNHPAALQDINGFLIAEQGRGQPTASVTSVRSGAGDCTEPEMSSTGLEAKVPLQRIR